MNNLVKIKPLAALLLGIKTERSVKIVKFMEYQVQELYSEKLPKEYNSDFLLP